MDIPQQQLRAVVAADRALRACGMLAHNAREATQQRGAARACPRDVVVVIFDDDGARVAIGFRVLRRRWPAEPRGWRPVVGRACLAQAFSPTRLVLATMVMGLLVIAPLYYGLYCWFSYRLGYGF